MALDKKDHTGLRGESISFVRLTEVCQATELPYFLPHFLGDKCPLFDILVELVEAGDRTLYFFAQVKSTRLGYNKAKRLRAEVSREDVRKMVLYPAPTYVIGIDEKSENAYIVAVLAGMTKKLSTLSTAHRIDCITLKILWDEVRDYWKDRDTEFKKSAFTN